MITTKRPNTDDYTQVGFIEAKDNQGIYQNIDHIYDNQGNIVFQQGYLNEYQGADDFGIPAIGKPLVDYTIYGNSFQDGLPTPENPIEPEFMGDLVSIELDEPLRAVGDYKDTLDLGTGILTRRVRQVIYTGDEDWYLVDRHNHVFACPDNQGYTKEMPNGISTHYIEGRTSDWDVRDCFTTVWTVSTFVCEMSCNSAEEFKTFLRQQYEAGTPVIIWRGYSPTTTTISIPDGLTGVIEGTVTQSGTPTPDNPIDPVFNGKLLPNGKYQVYSTYKIPISSGGVNLFDPENCVDGYILTNGYISNANQRGKCTDFIDVSNHTEITLSQLRLDAQGEYYSTIACWDENKQFIYGSRKIAWVHSEASSSIPAVTKVLEPNAKYIRVSIMVNEPGDDPISVQPMLNWGSEALPYEPYIAPTVKNIYLGQTPTIRRIKKLVLTGEETVALQATNVFFIRFAGQPNSKSSTIGISNQYQSAESITVLYARDFSYQNDSGYYRIRIHDSRFETPEDFKSYLAAQYAAGTPVIVWYVLAEPEVGIVNEPLAKIGDHADSITFEQAGVEIPTLKKPNTTVIDVETEVEPSEIDVTYRGTTKPQYDLFLAQNGNSFEAKDGQSLYIGGNP